MGRRSEPEKELVPLPVEPRSAAPAGERPGLDHPRRALGLGVLLIVLVGAVTLTGVGRGRHDAASGPPPATPARSADDEPAPDGWRRGSSGALRHRDGAVEVWTGSELVVWGGDPDGDTGAAYDPAIDRWRAIAQPPTSAVCRAAADWSGTEVLVWGRNCASATGRATLAYDPATDRWRSLAPPPRPLHQGDRAVSAWTGREWLVVSPAGPAAALDPASGLPGAFDPPVGTWRELPAAPHRFTAAVAAWTGRELLVFATELHEKGPSSAGPVFTHWVAALDPAAGRWRTLPEPPLELAATAVWDGHRLVAWDQDLHAAALDPSGAGGWRMLPDVPVDFSDCSPEGAMVGEAVFAEECGRAALLRPGRDVWERIAHPRSLSELPIWTGHDAVFWVGSFAGSGDGVWLYRPPAEPIR